MAPHEPTNAYLRNRVMTATREELRLMLLEGAIRFAHMARHGLETRQPEVAFDGFSQCRAIIVELIGSIKPEHDPDLAEKVSAVYTFIFSELVQASADKDIAKLDKVIELIDYERETWVLLMEQVASERAGGNAPMSAAPAAHRFPAVQPASGGSLSMQA